MEPDGGAECRLGVVIGLDLEDRLTIEVIKEQKVLAKKIL